MTKAPALDRVAQGLIAGAFVGAVLLAAGESLFISDGGWLGVGVSRFVIVAAPYFFLLALVLALTHPPIWLALRSLSVPDWLASMLASAAAFAAINFFLTVFWNHGYGAGDGNDVMRLLGWSSIGMISGFLNWRVAFRGVA